MMNELKFKSNEPFRFTSCAVKNITVISKEARMQSFIKMKFSLPASSGVTVIFFTTEFMNINGWLDLNNSFIIRFVYFKFKMHTDCQIIRS